MAPGTAVSPWVLGQRGWILCGVVEGELRLRWGDGRGAGGQAHPIQVGAYGVEIGEGGDDGDRSSDRANGDIDLEDPGDQACPFDAMAATLTLGGLATGAVLRRCGQGTGSGHDLVSIGGNRRQDPVVADEVEAGRGDQGGEFFDPLLWAQEPRRGAVRPVGLE